MDEYCNDNGQEGKKFSSRSIFEWNLCVFKLPRSPWKCLWHGRPDQTVGAISKCLCGKTIIFCKGSHTLYDCHKVPTTAGYVCSHLLTNTVLGDQLYEPLGAERASTQEPMRYIHDPRTAHSAANEDHVTWLVGYPIMGYARWGVWRGLPCAWNLYHWCSPSYWLQATKTQ